MGVNRVDYGGGTLINISDSTVTADKLLEGETAYGADGEKVTGSFRLEEEITAQDDLISQITTALEGKAGGSSESNYVTIEVTSNIGGYPIYYFLPDGTASKFNSTSGTFKARGGIILEPGGFLVVNSGDYTTGSYMHCFTTDASILLFVDDSSGID